MLSVPVVEAVQARVQATQVKAGKGEQEETSLRKLTQLSSGVIGHPRVNANRSLWIVLKQNQFELLRNLAANAMVKALVD